MHYRYRHLRFPGGKPKAVTFSYDDGNIHDIRLSQMCGRYGIKCTFNISAGFMPSDPNPRKLTPEDIQRHLLSSGHEIAIHGNYHKALGLCSTADGIKETLDCRTALEAIFQKIIRGMAYADSGITRMENGTDYPSIRKYLQDLGIAYARSLGGDNNNFRLPDDWFAWLPTAHHANPKALDWAKQFVALDPDTGILADRFPRLFFLWGHSSEFESQQNWDLLEDLCRILSSREDTWYATNIEICDYVSAYHSLIFSADGTRVYNPSSQTVWFATKNHIYTIHPGEEIATLDDYSE